MPINLCSFGGFEQMPVWFQPFPTVMDIDSVGTFTMCHEALKYLKKGGPGRSSSGGGTILNISATLHYTASWYQIHVSAAKVRCIVLSMLPISDSVVNFFARV